MIYKLYVETVQQDSQIGWSYAFYNHQNFMVYKRFGKSDEQDVNKVILQTSLAALAYFDHSIRRRYYDEHFSTRIDEDYVTLYSKNAEIPEMAKQIKSSESCSIGFIGEDKDTWEALVPYIAPKTMQFEVSTDEKFIALGKELALKGLE